MKYLVRTSSPSLSSSFHLNLRNISDEKKMKVEKKRKKELLMCRSLFFWWPEALPWFVPVSDTPTHPSIEHLLPVPTVGMIQYR